MHYQVGQRVRYVAGPTADKTVTCEVQNAEVVIDRVGGAGWDWVIKGPALADGIVRGPRLASDECYADSCQLRPLTDPLAERFLDQVKSWGALEPVTITAQLEESLLMVRGGSQ